MSNPENIVEVTLSAGAIVRKHQGNGIRVESGHLHVMESNFSVAIYAPNSWVRAQVGGNSVKGES